MRVLLIEDDVSLREGLREALCRQGYGVDAFGLGEHGLSALGQAEYDALVLDLGLPDVDGLALLRRVRAQGKSLPILLLTARGDWADRVRGLDEGADDYLVKPFVLPELLARLRALIRRSGAAGAAGLSLGSLHLDMPQQMASLHGEALPLTPKEWAVLLALVLQSPTIVSKRKLLHSLSEWDREMSSNALETHVSRLRHKLQGAGLQLDTVRGVGYRLMSGAASDA
ncbi:response regulator transcription factor [Paucibacter sp. AS339]|uniref:response regulator transcription factor n=1 Tax=Paucibacter hankyongi TaxID=3133434 RepID=UPI0030A86398